MRMLAITSAFWLAHLAPAQTQTADQVVDCGARTVLAHAFFNQTPSVFDEVSPFLGAQTADEAVEILSRLNLVFPRLLGFVDGCDFSFDDAALRIHERAQALVDEFTDGLREAMPEASLSAAFLEAHQSFEECLSEIGFESLLLAALNDPPCGWR